MTSYIVQSLHDNAIRSADEQNKFLFCVTTHNGRWNENRHEQITRKNELRNQWDKTKKKKKKKKTNKNYEKEKKSEKESRSASKLHKRKEEGLWMPFGILSILFLRVFLTCLSVLVRSVNKQKKKKKKEENNQLLL